MVYIGLNKTDVLKNATRWNTSKVNFVLSFSFLFFYFFYSTVTFTRIETISIIYNALATCRLIFNNAKARTPNETKIFTRRFCVTIIRANVFVFLNAPCLIVSFHAPSYLKNTNESEFRRYIYDYI